MLEKQPSFWRNAFDILSVYLLWFIVIALGLLCLVAARGTINILFILATANRWGLQAVDRFSLVLMGLVWLVVVIFAESYLREGADKGKLLRRFAILAGAEVLLYALLMLAQQIPIWLA